MTRAGRGSAATQAGTRGLQFVFSFIILSQHNLITGAVSTLEVGEEMDGTMAEVTITTSLAPVLLTAAGGREVLRRLPGPPTVEVVIMEMEDGVEDLADTQAITTVMEMEVQASTPATTTEVTEEGDVSETASVPALSSAATCTVATSALSLSTTADQTYKQSCKNIQSNGGKYKCYIPFILIIMVVVVAVYTLAEAVSV